MMDAALGKVAELIRRETGIVIRDVQHPALAAALARIDGGLGAAQFLAEAGRQPSGIALLTRLIDEVTIQETYFFREPGELAAVDWPSLLQRARAAGSDEVRVWVSACATGEEAYTIGILASEALEGANPPVSILGTDISGRALERARRASYSERAIRNVPEPLRSRYLIERDGRWAVCESLRSLVTFRDHNLIRDPSPPIGESPFEVVTCRNVLIYFDAESVERTIESLEPAVRRDGHLILGAADRLGGVSARLGRAAAAAPAMDRRKPRPVRPSRPVRSDPTREAPVRAWRAASPPSGSPRRRAEDVLEDALRAADAGDVDGALDIVAGILKANPLNTDAYFLRGLVSLRSGDTEGAAASFRRALYVEPTFALAAFQLGRSHDMHGDGPAARRAYAQALRTLDTQDTSHRAILADVDLADVAAACRARLAGPG